MKKLLLIVTLLFSLILTGCSFNENIKQKELDNLKEDGFTVVYEEDDLKMKEVKDTSTGVHYFMIEKGYFGGMTPVILGDGSYKVNGEKPKSISFETISESSRIKEVRHKETGVHYYIRTNGYFGGISPVILKNGKIKISEVIYK